MNRSDGSLVLNDILHELRSIRELLEWDKADTLQVRATRAAASESDKAEAIAFNEVIIEKGVARIRELNRQSLEEYKAVIQTHETLFHPSAEGLRGKSKAN